MSLFEKGLAEKMSDPEFREGYEEAKAELAECCIVFNWHGDAPNRIAGADFADAATDALVEVAEKFGCHVGGGFRITQDPCDECERLAACPFGSECVTCNPPTSSSAVVHMKAPTITGMS